MNWPSYPQYRDAAAFDGLPPIPAHWESSPVKRLGSIRYGLGEPPPYVDVGTPLIRATNIFSGRIQADGLVYVNPTDIPAQRILWLKLGDIIVVRSGAYTGDSAIVTDEYVGAIAGFDMVFRSTTASPSFVQYALLSGYLKSGQIDIARERAAQPHLNAEELGECQCILPPPDEQRGIVKFLDCETSKIDLLIAKQEQLIATLREDRTATVTHAVTKGLDPTVELKDSGAEWLGRIPAHWEVQKGTWIGRPFGSESIAQDAVHDSGDVPFLKVSSLHPEALYPESPVWFVNRGYRSEVNFIAFPKRGAAIFGNKVNIVRDRAVLDPNLMGWKLASGNLPEFYARVLKLIRLEEIADVSTVPQINTKHLASLRLPHPPLTEQHTIVAALDERCGKIDTLIAKANEVIETLREYRSALITDAVTGKIDVRGAVA